MVFKILLAANLVNETKYFGDLKDNIPIIQWKVSLEKTQGQLIHYTHRHKHKAASLTAFYQGCK